MQGPGAVALGRERKAKPRSANSDAASLQRQRPGFPFPRGERENVRQSQPWSCEILLPETAAACACPRATALAAGRREEADRETAQGDTVHARRRRGSGPTQRGLVRPPLSVDHIVSSLARCLAPRRHRQNTEAQGVEDGHFVWAVTRFALTKEDRK